MNPLLQKTWSARVELAWNGAKMAMNRTAEAETQLEARQKIEAAIRCVWKGWSVRFISVPVVVRALAIVTALLVTGCTPMHGVNGSHVAAALIGAGLVLACQVFAALLLNRRSEPAGECATCGEASTTHPTLFCCRRCNPSLFLAKVGETPLLQDAQNLNEKAGAL